MGETKSLRKLATDMWHLPRDFFWQRICAVQLWIKAYREIATLIPEVGDNVSFVPILGRMARSLGE
jgi:hypothetical protein